jgi:ribosomal protein S18 acetylase RimI-like enzyme
MHPTGLVATGFAADLRPKPEFRLATIADLQESYRVYVVANEQLNRQLGRHSDLEKHTLPTRALAVRSNALRCDPDRFWIADFGGKVGGFGLAIRRRTLWYLAALHVLPEFQGQGIGTELVRRCLGSISPADQPTMLTTSDSANPVSTGMYFRLGLVPQTAIIQLQGQPRSLGLNDVALRQANGPAVQECFNRIDKIVLSEIRPEDHQCWATVSSMVPYLVYERDRMVGYIYVDREGALGPAAVERPELLPSIISAALETYSTDHSAPVQIRIPSDAGETLRTLFSHGFNCITEVRLLLTSRNFGLFDQYLFSGADALF